MTSQLLFGLAEAMFGYPTTKHTTSQYVWHGLRHRNRWQKYTHKLKNLLSSSMFSSFHRRVVAKCVRSCGVTIAAPIWSGKSRSRLSMAACAPEPPWLPLTTLISADKQSVRAVFCSGCMSCFDTRCGTIEQVSCMYDVVLWTTKAMH